MQKISRSRCSTKSQDGTAKRGSALFVVVFLMLVGSVAADTKATKGNADAQHHNQITLGP